MSEEPSDTEIEAAARVIFSVTAFDTEKSRSLAEAALVAARRVLASYPPQEDAANGD